MKQSFFQRWDTWWCRSVPPHALAIFRILFGSYLFVWMILSFSPHIELLFSNAGFVQARYMLEESWLPLWIAQPPDPSVATIIFGVFLLSIALFTIGCLYRTSMFVTIMLCWYYWHLHIHLFYASFHRIFFLTLLVMFVSGAHKTFSVHMWRKRQSFFAWEPISILPQRLLAAQLTMTYLVVGWQKSFLPDWKTGEELSYSYLGKWGTPVARWFVRLNFPLWTYDIQVWMVKHFEYLLPFALWAKRFQKWAFLGGLFFHTFITVFLAIWWFMIVPAYYLFFVPPETIHAFCKKRSGGRIS